MGKGESNMYKIYHFSIPNVSIYVNDMARTYYVSNFNLNYDTKFSFTQVSHQTGDYQAFVVQLESSGYSRSYTNVLN